MEGLNPLGEQCLDSEQSNHEQQSEAYPVDPPKPLRQGSKVSNYSNSLIYPV